MKKWVIWFARVAFILCVSAIGYVSVTVAILIIVTVLLTFLQSKADSLIELSFGPLKAKLEKTVSESEKLITGLRKLSLAQSKALVSAAAHTGRFATDDAWIFHAAKDIEAGLKAIGATEIELAQSRSDLVRLTLRDLGACATNGGQVPIQLGEQAVSEWQKFRGTPDLLNPQFIETWLQKYNALGQEQRVVLEAMRYLINFGDIRNEEQFLLSKQNTELIAQGPGS